MPSIPAADVRRKLLFYERSLEMLMTVALTCAEDAADLPSALRTPQMLLGGAHGDQASSDRLLVPSGVADNAEQETEEEEKEEEGEDELETSPRTAAPGGTAVQACRMKKTLSGLSALSTHSADSALSASSFASLTQTTPAGEADEALVGVSEVTLMLRRRQGLPAPPAAASSSADASLPSSASTTSLASSSAPSSSSSSSSTNANAAAAAAASAAAAIAGASSPAARRMLSLLSSSVDERSCLRIAKSTDEVHAWFVLEAVCASQADRAAEGASAAASPSPPSATLGRMSNSSSSANLLFASEASEAAPLSLAGPVAVAEVRPPDYAALAKPVIRHLLLANDLDADVLGGARNLLLSWLHCFQPVSPRRQGG